MMLDGTIKILFLVFFVFIYPFNFTFNGLNKNYENKLMVDSINCPPSVEYVYFNLNSIKLNEESIKYLNQLSSFYHSVPNARSKLKICLDAINCEVEYKKNKFIGVQRMKLISDYLRKQKIPYVCMYDQGIWVYDSEDFPDACLMPKVRILYEILTEEGLQWFREHKEFFENCSILE